MRRIFCISDTHGFHRQVKIPEGIDCIVHAGDAGNNRNPAINYNELLDFFEWYKTISVKHKIYVPGNHCTAIEAGMFKRYDFGNTTLLNHQSIEIEDIKFFGSPYTPTFGDWAFNKKREKLHKCWECIPEDTDILITHGPPKGILDISENREYQLEYCGDLSLWKAVNRIAPKYHIFGHVHNCKNCKNYGTRTSEDIPTTFVNATMVEDGRFDKGIIHNGIIIEL